MTQLTGVELEVLRGVAAGETADETASRMSRSLGTVRHHRRHLLAKLHARTAAQAVAIAFERNILGPLAGRPEPATVRQRAAIYGIAGTIERALKRDRHAFVEAAVQAASQHFERQIDTVEDPGLLGAEASWMITWLREQERQLL